MIVATYSIAACDLDAGQWGVATQSRFLAVGSVVPWAAAGVGAVATQAYANPRYGPNGLRLLSEGRSAAEVVERLTEADAGRDERQLGHSPAGGAEPALSHTVTESPGSRCSTCTPGASSWSFCGVPVRAGNVPQWHGTQRLTPISSSATAASRGPIV